MEDNPFIVTGRIPSEYFCDRVKESEKIIRSVTSCENIVLMSARRMGKTGLVYHCFDDPAVSGNYATLFIDILPTSSLKELTFLLGKAVFDRLGKKSQKLMTMIVSTLKSINGSFGYDPIMNTPTFNMSLGDITDPVYTLEEIFACLEQADQRCIVAIDEFQQVASYPEKNVEAVLRTFIQKCRNTNFIFSGSERHLLEEMFRSSARPFYNSADTIAMKAIDTDVYADFVSGHFARRGKAVAPGVVKSVYDLFGGNTYYIQKVFHESFTDTPAGGTCDEAVTASVVESLVQENDTKFGETLSRLSLPQKELLYAVAKDGRAERITSSQFIKKHSLRSASSVQSAIRKLLDYHLVTSDAGGYIIDDPLIALWLRRYFEL